MSCNELYKYKWNEFTQSHLQFKNCKYILEDIKNLINQKII